MGCVGKGLLDSCSSVVIPHELTCTILEYAQQAVEWLQNCGEEAVMEIDETEELP